MEGKDGLEGSESLHDVESSDSSDAEGELRSKLDLHRDTEFDEAGQKPVAFKEDTHPGEISVSSS